MKRKILVTGATGKLGSIVVEALLEKTEAANIVVMIRNKDKVNQFAAKGIEVRIGNYNDTTSMKKAFANINTVYFVSGNDLEKRVEQHKNVVKAAKEAGIDHVAYTSFGPTNYSEDSPLYAVAKGHMVAEDSLKNSGVAYTILKHNLYMEVIPLFAGNNLLESKMIYLPAGDGKAAFMARKDMAVVAAEILTGSGHENKIYEISGERSYSFSEIASMITEISGKDINYISPSVEEFRATLNGYGVSEPAVEMTVMFAKGIAQGEFNKTSTTFKKLTGKDSTSLRSFLKEQYG